MSLIKSLAGVGLTLFITGMLISCSGSETETAAKVVNVKAMDFAFEAPDSIVSGWTTFQMENVGQQEHFFYVYRLPENKSFDQFIEEFAMPFGAVWTEYASGDISREETEAKMASELPGWYFTDVVPGGGVALTEPGATSKATVKLEPGLHVIECYVKMPDGRWHTEMGMSQPMVVTDDSTSATPPAADATLTLSNYKIETEGEFKEGVQTIAVHVNETPEGFMQHDINLFRLEGTQTDSIVAWMDWMDLQGFRAPAPGYSMGGMEHLPAGSTGYITVELTPGNYAWVSEGYGNRGMVETFTIE